jgi:ketosteroid isomerase-like protein
MPDHCAGDEPMTATRSAIEQQVLQAERALYDAMIARDFPALERILAPELVYVHSTAVAESRQGYLAGVAKGLYEYESIATRDAQVRVHGDVALIDGICDMRVGEAGQPRDLIHLLFVLVWVRDGAAWRLAHRHATRITAR